MSGSPPPARGAGRISAAPTPRRGRRTLPAAVTVLCAGAFALLAVLVSGRHGAPFPLDRDALDWSLRHRPGGWASAARAVTDTGTGVFPYACAVLTGLSAGRTARQRLGGAAGALAFLLAGQALRYGVMSALARPRPPVADWATSASAFSFPSGHATTSALMAGLLVWGVARRGRTVLTYALCALVVCWAVAVGLTRIYLGVHWATDVLGGWLFAGAWIGLCAVLIGPQSLKWRMHRPT
ncbi:phosphatase PAP2 family protein [Streptomyces sp. NPDC093109]|uniref:phosphatase PAP2 family protein n=1 Tax=Streptomyces sp. NPDC093109 TaxID=3154977 RepID=UPI00344E0BE4